MDEFNNGMEPQAPFTPTGYPCSPAPKQRNKKVLLIIGAAAAVLIIAAAAIIFTLISGNPLRMLSKAATATMKDISQSGICQYILTASQGGSYTVSADLEDYMTNTVGISLPVGIQITNYGFGQSRTATELAISLNDHELAGLQLYCAPSEFILASEELLGGEAYGISAESGEALLQALDSSIFAPGSGSDFEISESTYSSIQSYLENQDKGYTVNQEFLEEKAQEYSTELVSLIVKYTETEKERETISLPTGEIKTTKVILTIDSEGAAAISRQMLDKFLADEEFKSFLYEVYGPANLAGSTGLDTSIDELYDELETLYEDIDELAEEDFTLELDYYIGRSSGTIVRMMTLLTMDNGETQESLDMILGEDLSEPEYLSLTYSVDDEIETEVRYEITDRDEDLYAADLYISEYETVSTGWIEWDKKAGQYTISLPSDDEDFYMSGALTWDGTVLSSSISELSFFGKEYSPKITFEHDTTAAFPTAPDFIDVLSMSEDEVSAILDEITTTVYDLLAGAMVTAGDV